MNDFELEAALAGAVAREREAVTDVLRYLRELEKRRLFLDRGYTSLFAYCTGRLGYSEPEAQLRIQSMRLVRVVPETLGRLERGTLTMSVAAQIQSAARREKLGAEKVQSLVRDLSGLSKRETEKELASRFPKAPRRELVRHVAEDLVEIRFTVSRDEASLFEKLLDRKAHANFERSKAKLFVELAKHELKKLEGNPSQDAAPLRPGKERTRYISAATRRKIWRRDDGHCQYVDPVTKKKCESRHGVQLDHVCKFADGGTHDPENLRLFCGPHNRARN
ncbi:MAG: HNH endonuclease [Bdellovibrionota bacterium]